MQNKQLMEIIEAANYYVYGHYLDGKLFYVGKGTKNRCLDLKSRSTFWHKKVGSRGGEVVIEILETFETEEEALSYEKRIISEVSLETELVNYVYNQDSEKIQSMKEHKENILKNKTKGRLLNIDEAQESKKQHTFIKNIDTSIIDKINYLEDLIAFLANNLINTKKTLKILTQSLGINQTLIYNKESIPKDIQLLVSIVDELRTNIEMQTKIKKKSISKIVQEENLKFETNNLILTPNGSDKIMLMKNTLLKSQTGKILILTSDIAMANSTYLKYDGTYGIYSKNDIKHFYDESYKIRIMSYTEFGSKIKYNNKFVKDVKQIYCDEIHSLMYAGFKSSVETTIAMKYLFEKHEDKQIFYFAATNSSLKLFKKKEEDIFTNVKKYDYLKHPDIKKHIVLSEYKINNIEQIRMHLEARLETFNYFGYKCLAFSKTISSQNKIENIALEEGFKPISIWSTNNHTNHMNKEQLRVREHLLTHGNIPEPYNFLIINSAMQEGWALHDKSVKLAIMNTTNEIERVQVLGIHRNNIDALIYKVRDKESSLGIHLDDQWLNTPLTTEMKEKLCQELNLKDIKGRTRKWLSVSKMLEQEGYSITNEMRRINNRRLTYTTISK